MPADIEPVEPFLIEIRTAFNKMIDDILYINRERIERYKINHITALTSERVIILYKCKNTYNTRRCRCFKEVKRYLVYCHYDSKYDYSFLASLGDRTEIALILREEALGL